LAGASGASGIDVERVKAPLRVEGAQEVECAMASKETDLDDRLRPDDTDEGVQEQCLVTLDWAIGGLLEEGEMSQVRQFPSQLRPTRGRNELSHAPAPIERATGRPAKRVRGRATPPRPQPAPHSVGLS